MDISDVVLIKMGWSKKYKQSINCRKPRGFSQRAHCASVMKKKRGPKKRKN